MDLEVLGLPQSLGTALWGAMALLMAVWLDRLVGEPPERVHPVVWMGKVLRWWGERLAPLSPRAADWKCFWAAALVWCALAAMVFVIFWGLQRAAMQLHWVLAAAAMALLLKPLFAWRMLCDEVLAVEDALARSLPEGRERLARLVSRDVSQLSALQVRESAIESLAENLNDSVVAPLFWFVLLGLPGAALYRFANTADAMWGYPGVYNGQNWLWAGKWAARVDDVLSWLPARLTALLLAAVSGGLNLKRLRDEAHRTPSPNSGWPMAAMALSLGVCLQKPRVYALNSTGRAPESAHTHQALSLASKVVLALVFASGATLIFIAIGYFLWS